MNLEISKEMENDWEIQNQQRMNKEKLFSEIKSKCKSNIEIIDYLYEHSMQNGLVDDLLRADFNFSEIKKDTNSDVTGLLSEVNLYNVVIGNYEINFVTLNQDNFYRIIKINFSEEFTKLIAECEETIIQKKGIEYWLWAYKFDMEFENEKNAKEFEKKLNNILYICNDKISKLDVLIRSVNNVQNRLENLKSELSGETK